MDTLRIYRVDEKYIRFLHSKDSRVQFNKGNRRPYVGIVLMVGSYKYFVPMESPRPSHNKIRPGYHIMKLDKGNLGLLGFNNMIPIHKEALIEFSIDDEPDEQYASLLRRQASYINRNKASIFQHASKTYFNAVPKNNAFLNKICCDFKKLERACDKYNPNYIPQRKVIANHK